MFDSILRASRGVVMFGLISAMLACGDDANLIGPENQLEVTSATDQFQFQLTALDQVTDSRSYSWENTGTEATIDISQAITGGSAILTIRDSQGTVVHTDDIADDNDTTTSVGVAGTWTIDIVLTNTTGTFNVIIQKVT